MNKPWSNTRLGEIASVALSGVDKHIIPGEATVRLCNYLDVYRNRRLTKSHEFSSGSATRGEIERFRIRKGDVVITKDSETPDDIAVPSLIADDFGETICGYHLALIRPTERLHSGFLSYLFQSEAAKRYFLRTATGLTRFGLGVRAIASFPIPVPSLGEQGAIANILDAVDTALERTRAAIARARELDHSLLHELLEKGLEPNRDGKRKRPTHWKLRRVDEVADVGSGVTLGKDVSGFKSIELPYLRVANVQDGHLNLSTIKTVRVRVSEIENFRLLPGDVLMTEGGDLDKLGRGTIWDGQIPDCLHQNHIFRVRTDRAVLLPEFFALVIESDIAKRYFNRVAKRTTNLASTNKTQVRAFQFPVPPLPEQQQFSAIMRAAKATLSALVRKQSALAALKKSLMHDLLTGTVRVRPRNLAAILQS